MAIVLLWLGFSPKAVVFYSAVFMAADTAVCVWVTESCSNRQPFFIA